MIIKIKSAEQAEQVLRTLKDQDAILVFDLEDGLDPKTVPLVHRYCHSCKDSEYVGNNLHGKGFYKPAIYCENCGYAMDQGAVVMLAVQGDVVVARY